MAARVSLEAILKKAHVQDFGCRILNSAAAMFPELFKLILMVKIQVAKGSDGFRTEYLGCCTGISKSLFEIPIIGGYAAHSTQQDLGKQGMTMVVVTHEMGFARKVGTRVVFLDQGEIVEENTSEKFFENPQSERAKDFLSKVFYE